MQLDVEVHDCAGHPVWTVSDVQERIDWRYVQCGSKLPVYTLKFESLF